MKIIITKIFAMAKEYALNKVLVDRRGLKEKLPGPEQMLDIGNFFSGWIKDSIKFAVLVKYDPATHGFFEAIVDVKGFQFSFFEDEGLALKWLLD